MVEIQVKLVDNNRPGRKLKQLKGIIVHWTANVKPTAGAEAHLKYFGHTPAVGFTLAVQCTKTIKRYYSTLDC